MKQGPQENNLKQHKERLRYIRNLTCRGPYLCFDTFNAANECLEKQGKLQSCKSQMGSLMKCMNSRYMASAVIRGQLPKKLWDRNFDLFETNIDNK